MLHAAILSAAMLLDYERAEWYLTPSPSGVNYCWVWLRVNDPSVQQSTCYIQAPSGITGVWCLMDEPPGATCSASWVIATDIAIFSVVDDCTAPLGAHSWLMGEIRLGPHLCGEFEVIDVHTKYSCTESQSCCPGATTDTCP